MPISKADAAHLLRRTGFAGTKKQIAQLAKLDLAAAVDHVLDVSLNPPVVDPPELTDETKSEYDRWVAVNAYWLDRMRTIPSPIQEKMALFWHGHLCSSQEKIFNMGFMWAQNQLFRSAGMGSFHDLCEQMAIQPAMLLYLDNYLNVEGVPQENFARESMELFTLGVGQYTQDDVVSGARAWTGHGLNGHGTAYQFHSSLHDNGSKMFFGHAKNWNGPGILTEILGGAKRPIAAAFIASKLWSFLAYPAPDASLVSDLAAAFMAADLDVTALLRAILLRPEFFSTLAEQGLVRSPVEYVVAAMKYSHLGPAVVHPEWWLFGMGQAPFYPPNVSGWRQNRYWISSSAYWARAGFARYLTWSALDAGLLEGTGSLPVATAVDRAFSTFGIDKPSATTRASLEAFVTAERAVHGWAEQPNLITLTLLSPDFQLG